MKFYSQYGQDEYVYTNYFQNQKNGFMVDIGAMCGLRGSNSKFFCDLGWSGIMLEANPYQKETLEQNRPEENWKIINKALVPNEYSGSTVTFCAFPAGAWGEGLSGIFDYYDFGHLNRIKHETKQGLIKKIPTNFDIEAIKTADLFKDLDQVDFLSLDTEGGEYNILQSIDYDNTLIKTIAVENNYHSFLFKSFLETKNYKLVTRLGCDEIYVNRQFLKELNK